MTGGYGQPRRDADGVRLAPLLDGVCAVVVAGSEPATAVAVAVGAGRVQSGARRVAVADLVGDAPLILRLLPDDDPHGISDSFLFGVSFNKIARAAEGEEQLFLIPSGTEPVTTEEIYGSERWRRLAAGFHQVGALLVVVARPEVPGFAALCANVGAVLPVGALPVAVPEGVTILRAAEEAPPAPSPASPSPLDALLAASGRGAMAPSMAPPSAAQPGAGSDASFAPPPRRREDGEARGRGEARGEAASEAMDGDSARGGRRGLRVDAAGIVRPAAPPTDLLMDEEEEDEAPRPWWRAPSTLVLAVLALAGITLGGLHPEWLSKAAEPMKAAVARLTGSAETADSAVAAVATAPAATAPVAAPPAPAADSSRSPAPPRDSVPPAPAPTAAPTVAPPAATAPAAKPVAPPPAAPPAAAPAKPAPVSPAPPPAARPGTGPVPAVANPEEAPRAARFAIYVATSNTRDGALPDPRLRGAEALALSPVTDGGARWYRLTVGAEPTQGEAQALLARLRAKDPTVSGSIVSLPYAFLLERGVPTGQAAARVAALAGRGLFAYALRQPDGSASIYTGAFESPDQARTLADSLRGVAPSPTLVYRTGRAF